MKIVNKVQYQQMKNRIVYLNIFLICTVQCVLGQSISLTGKKVNSLLKVNKLNSSQILLNPPQAYINEKLELKTFFNPDEEIVFSWSPEITGKLKIGTSSNNYNLGEINISGSSVSLYPTNDPFRLSTGRYYAVITDGENVSNEIQFIIESQEAPTPVEPRGNISSSTPLFSWNAVPGVTAYRIIVSSTPFDFSVDSEGNFSVIGINVVWDYVTTSTSVVYGQYSPYSPFIQASLPIMPNKEYTYIILNMYDDKDVTFTSSVFGGVVTFTYVGNNSLEIPKLIFPKDEYTFNGNNNITFQWESVSNANYYIVQLCNRVTQFAGNNQEVDVPIWNTTTTNTYINFPAKINLNKGKFSWYVIAKDQTGSGTTSETGIFNYFVSTGKFDILLKSASSNADLVGFNIYLNSINGGYSPVIPFVVFESTSYEDSIPADTYQFRISKPGFNDTTEIHSILPGTNNKMTFYLRPVYSTISGKVIDAANNPVPNAKVIFIESANNKKTDLLTGLDGTFSGNVERGNYSVSASKEGYTSSGSINFTVDSIVSKLSKPLVITYNMVSITGKIINEDGNPIQLATVKISQGDLSYEINTDENGSFSFNLSPGTWVLDIKKNGFISPATKTYYLTAGNNLSDQVFTLISRANQVSGYVYLVNNINGQISLVPFKDVTVYATPVIGTHVSTVSTSSGQFTLNLKPGTYTFSLIKDGYYSDLNTNYQVTLDIAQSITDLVYKLYPLNVTVSGKVIDANGKGIGNATVKTQDNLNSTLSLSDGSYVLNLNPGTHILTAIVNGYASPEPKTISISEGQNFTSLDFILTPNAGSVTGHTLSINEVLTGTKITARRNYDSLIIYSDNNGSYILNLQPGIWNITASQNCFLPDSIKNLNVEAGHNIIIDFNLTKNAAVLEGTIESNGVQIINASVFVQSINDPGLQYSTQSGSGGKYIISVGAGRSYKITVNCKGYNNSNAITNPLLPSTTATFNFSLVPASSSISGLITDNTGHSISKAHVNLIDKSSGKLIDSTLTGTDGNYFLASNTGNYKILVRKPGYKADSLQLSVFSGSSLSEINFVLKENFALLCGIISGSDGVNLPGTIVNLINSDQNYSAISSSDGSYSISKVAGASYKLQYTKTGYKDSVINSFIINDGTTQVKNIRLKKLVGKITGTVYTTANKPVEGASVTATDTQNKIFSSITDKNGSYIINNLDEDAYSLKAEKIGFTSKQIFQTELISTTTSAIINFNDLVYSSSNIIGNIKDQDGNHISDAVITASGTSGSSSAISNFAGEFNIQSLSSGVYQVLAKKTGYTSANISVTLNDNKTDTINIILQQNTAKIKGVVKDELGNTLPFSVRVKAASSNDQFTTTTLADGQFEISGLQNEMNYSVLTDIIKEGYLNDTVKVQIPKEISEVTADQLIVIINMSVIKGNTGTGNATIKILNKLTNKYQLIESNVNGNYEKGFLSRGSYSIIPSKAGYVFNPSEYIINLSQQDTVTKNFSFTSYTGNIVVDVKDISGNGISSVNISAINTAGSFTQNGITDYIGMYEFEDLPVGNYKLLLTKDGFSSTPDSIIMDLGQGQTLQASFQLGENNSSVEGIVRLNNLLNPINDAKVLLRNENTGKSFTATTNADGKYKIEKLPKGNYSLVAVKSGYDSDTLRFNIGISENKTGQNLLLSPSLVTLKGLVILNGTGLSGATVIATSSNSFTTTTDQNGNYIFKDIPIKTGLGDTTTYEIKVRISNSTAIRKIIAISSGQIGTEITVPDFILPSGQIKLCIKDGVQPLSEVKVIMVTPDGGNITSYTDKNGEFSTTSTLISGDYSAVLTKDKYLTPNDSLNKFYLETDSSRIVRTFSLPYFHERLESINADENTLIKINYLVTPQDARAYFYYTKGSSSKVCIELQQNENSFEGYLPALFSTEEIKYYVEVRDNNDEFTSETYSITPKAKGILTQLSTEPDLNNQLIRKNDEISLKLIIKDGINQSLIDYFKNENHKGSVVWSTNNQSVISLQFPDPEDSTTALLKADKTGVYTLTAKVKLNNTALKYDFNVNVSDNIYINKFTLSLKDREIINKSSGCQVSYTAVDSLNRNIYLGNSLKWSMYPEGAGSISSNGFFVPIDSTIIGSVKISAEDIVTSVKSEIDINILAEINSNSQLTLSDMQGMILSIRKYSVVSPIHLGLSKVRLGPAKKYSAQLYSDETFVVADQPYNFVYNANIALPGDTLQEPATLEVPVNNSLDLLNGEKHIGYYDTKDNQWKILNSTSGIDKVKTNKLVKFGVYSIMSANEPLGIRYISFLPNPFSPEVSPVRIGYLLTTNKPPALVTIRVINMRGEIVRTIIENDQQYPGKYGSRSGVKEITWNGLTDNGLMARNGRYIIQINAKDYSGEINELKTIVLVK